MASFPDHQDRNQLLGFHMENQFSETPQAALEVELPVEIIQHIQSFLGEKEATRTSLLSKSWKKAWSNCRIISFDLTYNNRETAIDFIRETTQRYKELNLKADRFRLNMFGDCTPSSIVISDQLATDIANQLVMDALNSGVYDFDLKSPVRCPYVLPNHVFLSRSLTLLSLSGCSITQFVDGRVMCSNLIYLTFHDVHITDAVIRDILLGCPLVKYLDVYHCWLLSKVNVSQMHNLKKLSVAQSFCKVEFVEPSVFPMLAPNFHSLISMYLQDVRINDAFFYDFSSRFPHLEDLTVENCYGYPELRISSHSLKRISLKDYTSGKLKEAHFDVPNVLKFKYVSWNNIISSLSFATTSNEWESDIFFEEMDSIPRFHLLGKLLIGLSGSRISLNLDYCMRECNYHIPYVHLSVKVENLRLTGTCPPKDYGSFMVTLFGSCRPTFITQPCVSDGFFQFMYQKLNEHLDSKTNCACLDNLKAVYFEYYVEILKGWQSVTRGSSSDHSIVSHNKKEVRLRLRWGK